ncbi:Mediator of RNA polymerase II transcription subunit 4 [Mycena indigotica]|uniref:Mediator of RNA polymerase II transcription subunit 4 n=1 Tax=Mycena indigotica TaxID=2126181 RepID=A0A8H6T536_9AGAR|nr:Mediator of RNA polymerase II transcription subunit 4 [Mycena indigotica]KAF7309580.1 Mediator of RNA polymerase II transcription subunit 4 [Mycena indigotica]
MANDSDSMVESLLRPLSELQTLSHTLFMSLSPPQTKPPPPPSLAAFIACDEALASAVNLAYTHQIKQRKIEVLKEEILELDGRWREICTQLNVGKYELEQVIEEGQELTQSIEQAKKASIPYPELLALAQSLSSFTSAPPNMSLDPSLPGQPPLFFPPFPTEEKLRRGKLENEAPLAILGETHSIGRAPVVSPPKVLDPNVNSYQQDHRPQQQLFDLDLDLNPDL